VSSTYRSSLPWRLFNGACTWIDKCRGWDRLPRPLGLLVLIGLRNELRRQNLHDTDSLPATDLPPIAAPPEDLSSRQVDGTYNDPASPRMGMAGARFGRNVPLDRVDPNPDTSVLDPSPREVSRRLLTRHRFQPATSINAIVAAWLQFMIHDWFSHGHGDKERGYRVPLSADDDWQDDPMLVPRTVTDPTRPAGSGAPPTFVNTLTHWWDLSSIYGTTAEEQRRFRAHDGGLLAISPGGHIPLPADSPERDPTRVPGFWVGLGMLASLFAHEHNAICARLADEYPEWSDEQLFQHARLVNAAVVAKIHTVEWTPAVIAHPTTRFAMRANWFGLAGERVRWRFGRFGSGEIISGIPGSSTQHYGVPYSLTEEFTAVYRMHPLLPDDYVLRSAATTATVREVGFGELAGPHARDAFAEFSLADLFYSFGTGYAGAMVLGNYPRALQRFVRPDDKLMDMAAIDILRIREAGVPRYNEFRRQLRLRPAGDFTDLSDDPDVVRTMRELYTDDIEKVDLVVGMLAEKRPTGFGFSDTAFRIFILMASRRLNSDRFFTHSYDPHVYTEVGVRWIDEATMSGVLLRHCPLLAPRLDARFNAFQPWPDTPPP